MKFKEFKARLRRAWKVTLEEWKSESNMKPETNEDTEDKSSAPVKDKALALAKAGDLPGALAAANTIEDAEERAAALEAIATATAEQEQAPPVVDVAQKRANANTGVRIGVIMQVFGFYALQTDDNGFIPGILLILLSLPPFIWGCMNYAAAKGYTKEVGLLGLLSIIGLNILVLLPDKLRDGPKARIPLRKIWMLVELVLGLGLVTVGSVLEDAAFQRGDINRGFEWSLIVLGLILITISLLMLLSNWKETQPKSAHEA